MYFRDRTFCINYECKNKCYRYFTKELQEIVRENKYMASLTVFDCENKKIKIK